MMMGSGRSATRFYAQGAPRWWPFQLVSLGNKRLPPKRYGFYSILVDNGMFRYYKEGTRPSLDSWFRRLAVFAGEVRRLRPSELIIILPDWLNDAEFTVRAARSVQARRLCEQHVCCAVAHAGRGLNAYARTAEELVSIDYIQCIAAPLKLNCSRYSAKAGRRLIRLECQAAVAGAICGVAKRHDLKCHGLGIALKPEHVRRLVGLGLDSFDSTSWTRPNKTVIARYLGVERLERGEISAKTIGEKELFFLLKLAQLVEAGVSLESPEVSLLVGEKLRFTCFL